MTTKETAGAGDAWGQQINPLLFLRICSAAAHKTSGSWHHTHSHHAVSSYLKWTWCLHMCSGWLNKSHVLASLILQINLLTVCNWLYSLVCSWLRSKKRLLFILSIGKVITERVQMVQANGIYNFQWAALKTCLCWHYLWKFLSCLNIHQRWW